MKNEVTTESLIGAAIEVHREIGNGLLEKAYEACYSWELTLRDIPHERQVSCAINYKGLHIEDAYRIDVFVDRKIVVELKAVEGIEPKHEAQLLTYLQFTGSKLGLIINFREKLLKDGIKRMVL